MTEQHEETSGANLPSELTSIAPAALDVFVRVADVVHGPASPEEKVAFVLATAREATGATAAGFFRLDADEEAPLATGGDLAPDDLDEPTIVEIVRRTLRAGEVLHATPRISHPERGGDEDDAVEVVGVPVVRRGGPPHGALVLAGQGEGDFGERAVAFLQALAAHLGIAFDNLAQVHELEELRALQKEVVHQLQEAVRPPMPVVDATELGVHYLPADPQAPTGGDLYDWQVLPDGDLHLVVVDVMGKGVAATKDALTITHVVRLLVMDGCPLERLVARADALLAPQHPDLVATMIVARYTPSTGVLRLAGAGHPPVLVLDGDRRVREVAAPGIPIGWPGSRSFEVVTLALGRRDTAIFYTDGLIEATKDIEQGLARLQEAVRETSRYPGQTMARALVERALADRMRSDDSVALVLRRRTPPSITEAVPVMGPFEYRFSPTFANVPLVRHFFDDWLRTQGVEMSDRDDLLLIASELAANAVRVATGREGGLALRARADGDSVVVEVEDDAGTLEWPPPWWDPDELPDLEAEEGRGLFLVHSLADAVDAEVAEHRTRIRAVKRAVLPAVAPETEGKQNLRELPKTAD